MKIGILISPPSLNKHHTGTHKSIYTHTSMYTHKSMYTHMSMYTSQCTHTIMTSVFVKTWTLYPVITLTISFYSAFMNKGIFYSLSFTELMTHLHTQPHKVAVNTTYKGAINTTYKVAVNTTYKVAVNTTT